MSRPALAGSLVGGAVALTTVIWFVSHTSCSSANAPNPPALVDSGAACGADSAVPPAPPPEASLDAVASEDAPEASEAGKAGCERCPDPGFPPRTDGCPCSGGGDPTSPFVCTEAILGKVCEYKHECPAGLIRRYQCSWTTPFEGSRYLSWNGIESRSCERATNDSGAD